MMTTVIELQGGAVSERKLDDFSITEILSNRGETIDEYVRNDVGSAAGISYKHVGNAGGIVVVTLFDYDGEPTYYVGDANDWTPPPIDCKGILERA